MTSRLSLPADLPGPCPVCGETVTADQFSSGLHYGHCAGYNRAIEDVVAWLREHYGYSSASVLAIDSGDAFGAARR